MLSTVAHNPPSAPLKPRCGRERGPVAAALLPVPPAGQPTVWVAPAIVRDRDRPVRALTKYLASLYTFINRRATGSASSAHIDRHQRNGRRGAAGGVLFKGGMAMLPVAALDDAGQWGDAPLPRDARGYVAFSAASLGGELSRSSVEGMDPNSGTTLPSSASATKGHVSLIADRYEVLRELGRGAYGSVVEAVDTVWRGRQLLVSTAEGERPTPLVEKPQLHASSTGALSSAVVAVKLLRDDVAFCASIERFVLQTLLFRVQRSRAKASERHHQGAPSDDQRPADVAANATVEPNGSGVDDPAADAAAPHLLRLKKTFRWRDQECLVFERMGPSLHDAVDASATGLPWAVAIDAVYQMGPF